MKKIIVSCLLIAMTGLTHAQDISIEAGLKGTLNFARLTQFEQAISNEIGYGFGIGAYGQFGLSGFFVRPELTYSYESLNFNYSFTDASSFTSSKAFEVGVGAFKIPILLGKSFLDNKVGVYTGINLSFKVDESTNSPFVGEQLLKDASYSLPLGFYIELGVIKVDARYNFGLSSFSNDEIDSNPKSDVIEISVLYQVFEK